MKQKLGIVLLILMAISTGSSSGGTGKEFLVGVKIYEYAGSFPLLFDEWQTLGINTVFAGASLASNPEFRNLAKERGLAVFIIFPVFYDPEALAENSDLFALTAAGQKAREDWVQFVCPTRWDYRNKKAEFAKKLVRDCQPDGLSLDFIRYFVFWEMVYPEKPLESLPNTCFCPNCLEEFRKASGIRLPKGLEDLPGRAKWILENHSREWTEWKCGVIADTIKELAAAARKEKPDIKINLHCVPWRKDDFGGAIRIIAGQDLGRIAPLADYLSPMGYHHMVMRPPTWIQSIVEDADGFAPGRILPSIQVDKAYIEADLTLAEFMEALNEALKPPSAGVVFWSWDSLSKSPEKKAVLKALFK